jgi:hypothetical protein
VLKKKKKNSFVLEMLRNSTLFLSSSSSSSSLATTTTAATSARLTGLFSLTPTLLTHQKNTARRPRRTAHTEKWYRQSKASFLTAKTTNELRTKPAFPHFTEEVDKPFVMPATAAETVCFNCKSEIEHERRDRESYVWIPSGNAKAPTSAGYFFHTRCFRCDKCGFRFHHNKFFSQDNKAICMTCALGRQSQYPYRWWHGSDNTVTRGRTASRMTGHMFPRHQHQTEFLHDPDG